MLSNNGMFLYPGIDEFIIVVNGVIIFISWSLKRLVERMNHAKEEDVQYNGDRVADFPGRFAADGLLAGAT